MNNNVDFILNTARDYDLQYDTVFSIWYSHIGGNQMKYDYDSFYAELEKEISKNK